jgi:hypothetical protein
MNSESETTTISTLNDKSPYVTDTFKVQPVNPARLLLGILAAIIIVYMLYSISCSYEQSSVPSRGTGTHGFVFLFIILGVGLASSCSSYGHVPKVTNM